MQIEDRVFIVTGASSGIGLATAIALSGRGAKVALLARRTDGLVNNAGRSYAASVEEIDTALFEEIFHLNVLGPIVAMQAVIPPMRTQGGGSIVNINSGTAFMTIPQYSVYSSSKRALLGLSLTA